jgi:uncharacterized phiE125 gp8 family phage protein
MAVTPIVSLQDTKSFLNMTQSTADAELSDFIDAASQMIVNRIGPVLGLVTYDEWYDGGGHKIALRHTPVLSITSITESWGSSAVYTLNAITLDGGSGTFDNYSYTVDLGAGILVRRVSGSATRFARGIQNVHIVYVGGYANVPADLKQAAQLLVKHMWETQRGGSKRPGQGGEDWQAGQGDAWPARVEEILANYYLPGIA